MSITRTQTVKVRLSLYEDRGLVEEAGKAGVEATFVYRHPWGLATYILKGQRAKVLTLLSTWGYQPGDYEITASK